MTFVEAVTSNFQNYSKVKGRASRSEYWWFTLFLILASLGFSVIDIAVDMYDIDTGYGIFSGLFEIATIIPSVAVSVRRLHDVGHTGWWIFMAFTIIGILLLLYWFIKKSDENENEYGENPRQTEPVISAC